MLALEWDGTVSLLANPSHSEEKQPEANANRFEVRSTGTSGDQVTLINFMFSDLLCCGC